MIKATLSEGLGLSMVTFRLLRFDIYMKIDHFTLYRV